MTEEEAVKRAKALRALLMEPDFADWGPLAPAMRRRWKELCKREGA